MKLFKYLSLLIIIITSDNLYAQAPVGLGSTDTGKVNRIVGHVQVDKTIKNKGIRVSSDTSDKVLVITGDGEHKKTVSLGSILSSAGTTYHAGFAIIISNDTIHVNASEVTTYAAARGIAHDTAQAVRAYVVSLLTNYYTQAQVNTLLATKPSWTDTSTKLATRHWVLSQGFLTTESDPVFTAHASYSITNTYINNWNTAYGWCNHDSAG